MFEQTKKLTYSIPAHFLHVVCLENDWWSCQKSTVIICCTKIPISAVSWSSFCTCNKHWNHLNTSNEYVLFTLLSWPSGTKPCGLQNTCVIIWMIPHVCGYYCSPKFMESIWTQFKAQFASSQFYFFLRGLQNSLSLSMCINGSF